MIHWSDLAMSTLCWFLRHDAPLVVVFSCLHGEKTRYYLDDYCGNLNWIWNSPCTSHTFLFHPNSGRVESSLMMVFPQQKSEWDVWKTDFPFKSVSEHKELYNSITVYASIVFYSITRTVFLHLKKKLIRNTQQKGRGQNYIGTPIIGWWILN